MVGYGSGKSTSRDREQEEKSIDTFESEYSGKIEEVGRNEELEKNRIREIAKRQAKELSQRERIKIEREAKLQAKRIIFEATQKMLKDNLNSLKQTLEEWTRSNDYEDLLPRMVNYASKRLGVDIRVMCRQADVRVLEKTWGRNCLLKLELFGGALELKRKTEPRSSISHLRRFSEHAKKRSVE